tara:strand:- start:5059 stop:5436 length:378 start_codon:yes stop_codon:yes gene_type:complete
MIKTAFAAAAAAAAFAAPGAALAGPYVNVETNAGWTGTDYTGATTDFHVGYEGALGESAAWYVQGGASYVAPDGAADDTVPSGKAGISVAATEALGVYGEVSFQGSGDSDVDRGYGGKLGVKYAF